VVGNSSILIFPLLVLIAVIEMFVRLNDLVSTLNICKQLDDLFDGQLKFVKWVDQFKSDFKDQIPKDTVEMMLTKLPKKKELVQEKKKFFTFSNFDSESLIQLFDSKDKEDPFVSLDEKTKFLFEIKE
jgi:hypothetical protein